MPSHSDRRRTQQFYPELRRRGAKSGPPLGVVIGSPSDSVAQRVFGLARATSPRCATLLAEKLPMTITAMQLNVIWLY